MATSFKKTQLLLYPRVQEKPTPDALYCKHLDFPITRKEHAQISYIDFSPVSPYNYAVTSSNKIKIYSQRTNEPLKAFSRFREVAYSGSYRSDGKLLVAGGEYPDVQLFDVARKSQLRTFKGHTGAVHVTRFTSDNRHVFSGSDDKTVRVWDISSESESVLFNEHLDYIRCGYPSSQSDILITGSYDHTVKMFDVRTQKSVITLDQGHPVESVVVFPGGGVVIAAAGNTIKVWDVVAGRLLTSFSNHHKTITSLCFANNYNRLVSASLDRHVKFYDVTTYQAVHTLDYPSAILSVAVAPDDSLVTVGMLDGLLSIQRRKNEKQLAADVEQKREERKRKRPATFALQAYSHVPDKDDHVVEHRRKEKLAEYDKFFRKFEYSKALEAAMNMHIRKKSPEITIGVLQELIRRDGLRTALAGRNEKSLGQILTFLQRNVSDCRFNRTIFDVTNIVIDLYAGKLETMPEIQGHFSKLQETLVLESEFLIGCPEMMGVLHTIMFASGMPPPDCRASGKIVADDSQNNMSF